MPRKLTEAATALADANTAKFAVNDWQRLERFLIIGTESNRYTSGPQTNTLESAVALERCVKSDGNRAVNLIINISETGRAIKNDVAVFAMAAALKIAKNDPATRSQVYQNLGRVIRTGTHLLNFMQYCKSMNSGSGRGLRKAVAEWYLKKLPDQAAYQVLKYQSRDGWSHRDVLRLVHPGYYNGHQAEGRTPSHNLLFEYAVEGNLQDSQAKFDKDLSVTPKLLQGFMRAREVGKSGDKTEVNAETTKEVVRLITDYGLTREMIPTEFLNSKEVWDALLQKMPLTATVRNLGKMTSIQLIERGSAAEKKVVDRLSDEAYLRKSRIHPVQILIAERVYRQGHGQKGSLSWSPTPEVNKAMNEAFYKSFINAPKTDKKYYIGVDGSGSMTWKFGDTDLQSIEAAMAMALVIQHAETKVDMGVYAGTGRMHKLKISRGTYLDTACKKATSFQWGNTDCGSPYREALRNGEKYDVFINITDNYHNSNSAPHLALTEYRQKTGVPAKQIVIGTRNSAFTIADPNDPGSLDIAGFDAAIPALVADFASDGKAHLPADDAE